MGEKRMLRVVPITIVVLIVVTGLIFVVNGHWLRGSGVLGVAAGVGAILRLCVPDRVIGPLRVRGRTFDVLFLGAIALMFILGSTAGVR